ncbi:MAG: helix-turn-helix transcriptional regulator [Oscillibacter sp.]|nr:helix-turn-helix transcriptional regulator [Oscillibacter sp.]
MNFSEKLIRLRRKAGLSQEQLAAQLDVTRQSVSKWESGSAVPELGKLIALSDLFGVTIDYLVKDTVTEPERAKTAEAVQLERRLNELAGVYHERFGPYFSYTSKKRLFGLPLVSIRFGRDRHPSKHTLAVGIIAIGNFSIGIVSIGMISAGLLSLGMIAFGAAALGMVSLGWWGIGISVIGASVRGISAVSFLDHLK